MFMFTSRLRLGPLENHHLPDLVAAMREPGVHARLGSVPFPYSEQDGRIWLGMLRAQSREDLPIHLGLVERYGGRMVGCVSVEPSAPMPEIGFWIAPWAWRQGYATEAVQEILEEADARGAQGVCAKIPPNNYGALGVMRRCGFYEIGREVLAEPLRDGSTEAIVFERWA